MTNSSSTIFITGAAGFLGRHVARFFSEQGWSVVGIDQTPPENAPLANLRAYSQMTLPDPGMGSFLKEHRPDVCVHCAGRASVGCSLSDPVADYYSNAVLVFEVLNAIRLHVPQCRFINISSAAVYGNPQVLPIREDSPPAPISPYGFHKLQSEHLCGEFHHIYGVPTVNARIFSAYGPGLRRQVLWDICQKALAGKQLILQGSGEESRDFIHAHDIARAFYTIARHAPMKGEVYNLATGEETRISELVSLLLEALHYDGDVIYEGHLPEGTPRNWNADISKLKALGFDISIPLHSGVKNYAVWCRTEWGVI